MNDSQAGCIVYLLKAGGTAWDTDNRLIGITDLPMDPDGECSVVESLKDIEIDIHSTHILTSEEEAADDTARLIKSRLKDARIKNIQSLHNPSLGLWEGTLADDLRERCPSTWDQWLQSPERVETPNGETFNQAQLRLVSTVTKNIQKSKGYHKPVVLVLRSWAWVLVRCWLQNEPIQKIWEQLEKPTQLESFCLSKDQIDKSIRALQSSA